MLSRGPQILDTVANYTVKFLFNLPNKVYVIHGAIASSKPCPFRWLKNY